MMTIQRVDRWNLEVREPNRKIVVPTARDLARRPIAIEHVARRQRQGVHVRDEEPAQLDRVGRDHHHLPVDDLDRPVGRDPGIGQLQVAVD